MTVVKPEYIRIRDVFPHEAQDFTPWIEANIDALSNRLGFTLTVLEREKKVGSFNVDLYCEDNSGNKVIIENQLERTNHDHLGKLLTYMINLDATAAIWIATDVQPEHQRVLDRLNEVTGEAMAFYFVQVEAVRDSMGAHIPIFNVVARPDVQTREIGGQKKEWTAIHHKCHQFWSELLERSRSQTSLFNNISPSRGHSISMGAGKSGIMFAYIVAQDRARVELYIDYDQDTGEKNKVIFEVLHREKDTIEQEFGEPLSWEALLGKRSCRIAKRFNSGGLSDETAWPTLQNNMIDAMLRFDNALSQRIQQIEV